MANDLIKAVAPTFLTTATATKGIGPAAIGDGATTLTAAMAATTSTTDPLATRMNTAASGATTVKQPASQAGTGTIFIALAQPLAQSDRRSTSVLEITASLLAQKEAKQQSASAIPG